ncbi:hypothetical protein JY448_13495 [Stenotrophomonas maltophilia]|nr:hypothetical protein [Stenotrophomonas maltophilia]
MTTIYDAIDQLENAQLGSEEEAGRFLGNLTDEVQEQLIAGVFIGRDHIHAEKFNPGAEISRTATDHIEKDAYPRILHEKATSLPLYLGSLKKCATNEGFDLNSL